MEAVPRRRGRIIPARAGFTLGHCSLFLTPEDHPRSRGVYARRRRTPARLRGSSPLARGLPRPHPPGGRQPGIIPARAGFTAASPAPNHVARDHPRSRGVYAVAVAACSRRGGSSPLARGLPGMARHFQASAGIIPARAGFTAVGGDAGAIEWDHPRSRGVYAERDKWMSWAHGSSPLARGLPDVAVVGVDGGRIIPARAGFTILGISGVSHR